MARILVVDDNRFLSDAMESSLRAAGHTTERASSGADALCCVRGRPSYDLLLLDVLMPGLTGVGVLAELPPDAPPVVLMTGQPDAVPSPLPAAVRHVLLKTFETADLLRVVNDVLAQGAAP